MKFQYIHSVHKSSILSFSDEFWDLSPNIKGTVMQIKKALINDHLRVSKVSWKFRIPTIYNFAVIYL